MWRMLLSAVLVLSAGSVSGGEGDIPPSPLLAIDQNRGTVIERIVSEWGVALEQSSAGTSRTQLRTLLEGLRADHLLAASLVGSVSGLRDVLGTSPAAGRSDSMLGDSLAANQRAKPGSTLAKALGDANQDLVYTPVAPCRLFDTRASQGGLGRPGLNVRRSYGAIAPVASQGGPGGCAAGASAAVALIQIGTLSPSGSGLLQGGSQGAASFPNALILYQVGDQYRTAVAMPLNPANGQFDLVEQFATADLYGDLLGYFKPATFGVGNSASGTYSTVSGGGSNVASGVDSTIAGGEFNIASGDESTVGGGYSNTASGIQSTVPGGGFNTASGDLSFAAGQNALADQLRCFVFAGWSSGQRLSCLGSASVARFGVDHGFSVEYASPRPDGGGTKWFYVGDVFAGKSISSFTGAYLSDPGGVWTNSSDRHRKEDFSAIDAREVLARVVDMPITRWRYIGEDEGKRHIGPMAQDFYAQFRLGDDDTHIATVDADGVALAAIQGLNAKLEERDAATQRSVQERDAMIGLQAARVAELELDRALHTIRIAELERVRDAQAEAVADLRRAVELLLARSSPDGRLASVR